MSEEEKQAMRELKELSDRQHEQRTKLRNQIEEIRARHRRRKKS
jgi:transposase